MLEIFKIKPKSVQIDAVITRANGDVERLGTIVYHSQNPLKNLIYKLKTKIKEIYNYFK